MRSSFGNCSNAMIFDGTVNRESFGRWFIAREIALAVQSHMMELSCHYNAHLVSRHWQLL